MAVDENGPKLKTLDDLTAAMAEGGSGKCERCRREAAVLRIDSSLRHPRVGKTGPPVTAARVLADGCEHCGVEILAVVARSVGRVR